MDAAPDAADDDLDKLLEFDDLDPFGGDAAPLPSRVALPPNDAADGFSSEGTRSSGVNLRAVDACGSGQSVAAFIERPGPSGSSSASRKRDRGGSDESERREGRDRREGWRLLSSSADEGRDPEEGSTPLVTRLGSVEGVCRGGSSEIERPGMDPIRADYPQGTDPRIERGAERDGREAEGAVSLSSAGIPVARDGELDVGAQRREAAASPVPTLLGYRIPGPAGPLQTLLSTNERQPQGPRHADRNFGSGGPSDEALMAAEALDFREGPWLAAMAFLDDGDPNLGKRSPRSTIANIKATKRHIPQVVAVVKTVVPSGFGDLFVTLKDPTGTMGGNIHRRVLTELEGGHLVAPGAVVILRQVAVFSPTPASHYLNITVDNVDRIFGKDTVAARNPTSVADRSGLAGETRSDHSERQASFHDRSRVRTVHEQEIVAEHNDGNEVSGSAVEALGIFAETTDRENLQCEVDAEAKATQEAIAKAAGWNFGEDIDLLLAEDFPF